MRLFLAVPIPEDHAERLFHALPEALPGVRRTRPEAMHVTLAFLGATSGARSDEVEAAADVAATRTAAFSFPLDRLGRFPAEGFPRTVWAGPATGAADLELLASRVRAELRARRLGFDAKPFRPHVTIARIREGQAIDEARAVAAAIASVRLELPVVRVREIGVVESILSPRGARYIWRASARLRGPAVERR
ncbi:MAG: RNA 2',3'-cyclic phosphodiesterase [Chloroflexota bacterium]|nr:RNA 2',3'-cyclic phosphodiesterase [Chloroflexota bacterium]